LGDVLKKYEFDKAKLEAIFSKKHTPKNMFILHMLIILHIFTLLNHNIFIHIMLNMLHAQQACSYSQHTSCLYIWYSLFMNILWPERSLS